MGLVVMEACGDYGATPLRGCLERVFDHLGGIRRYVKPGMRVLLKPNLLSTKKPDDAATTHPAFVQAIVEMVMDAGGLVTIIDSPGGPYHSTWLKRVYASTGMEGVADVTGAKLNADLRVETVALSDGILLKSVRILKPLVEAELIINLAKLKTHMMMVYTGAVKNMFGAVAGTEKADYHARMHDYDRFAEVLVDIHRATAPTLNLIDGIVAMEGEGPGSGVPRHLGAVIAAENAFDADALALSLIGVPWKKVPVMRAGEVHGWFKPDEMEHAGVPVAQLACSDFNVPSLHLRENGAKPGSSPLSILGRWIRPRPVVVEGKCIRCRRCMEACPVKVIQLNAKGWPQIHPADCIRCFCCHELCPDKAIRIRRGLLSKLLMSRQLGGN